MDDLKGIYATVDILQLKDFNFFEKIILDLITKYKTDSRFKGWYAAIGDNCNGKLDECFISIGMVDKSHKIVFSRIRIPKNEIGKKVMEKFIRSYLVSGIKSKNIVNNDGINISTIGYITALDGKYLEIYTVNEDIIIENNKINIDSFFETNADKNNSTNSSESYNSDYDSKKTELEEINDKLDYLNNMLNMD